MKLIHKIILGILLVVAAIGFFGFRSWQLDQKVEKAIDGHYYKWSDDKQRIDFLSEDGEFTINWTKTNEKNQTITNYQYEGDINGTNLDSDHATKQEYQQTTPKDSIKATDRDFKIVEYSSEILKIRATEGSDTKTYTLTSDGVVVVEQQKRSIIQWIVDTFANLWNRIVDIFQ